jgi:two-component system, OmpR family, response regulator CpxR
MAIITLFSGSFCHGEQVAQGVSRTLAWKDVSDRLLPQTAGRYGIPEQKLQIAMHGSSPSLFGSKYPKDREIHLARLKIMLLELARADNVLYSGFAGLLLDREISHVLRVCLIANLDYRVDQAVATLGISPREARKRIHKNNEECAEWTDHLYGLDPWNTQLHDIIIPMHTISVDQAVAMVCENAVKEALRTTPESRQLLEDAALAASVSLVVAEKGEALKVTSRAGKVDIEINKAPLRLEPFQEELKVLAAGVEGVREVRTHIGSRFLQPSITRSVNLEVPTKILLVDDEREFVQTLSERLQNRSMETAIAYDGEEALSSVASNEPEVMVLDLKMPGIDGLEVLRRVKQEHPDVEVIILTGHGSEREEALARELGAFAYLEKPVNIDVLADTMKAAYRQISDKKAARTQQT